MTSTLTRSPNLAPQKDYQSAAAAGIRIAYLLTIMSKHFSEEAIHRCS